MIVERNYSFDGCLVTVHSAEPTPDLRQCFVYVGVIGKPHQQQAAIDKLTKERAFIQRDLYKRVTGKDPAFAQVPGIQLKSVKIKSKMTTAIFADSVNRRYGKCMALALQMQNRPVLMAPKWFWPD